jgi:hypothetical protein
MIRSCPDRLEFKNECYSTIKFVSDLWQVGSFIHRGSQLYFHIARYMLKEKGGHFLKSYTSIRIKLPTCHKSLTNFIK